MWSDLVYQFRREAQATQESAEVTIALCSKQGFTQILAQETLARGWALVDQGQGEEGIAQIQQGLATLLALGADLFRSMGLGLLAVAYGKVGQAEKGLSVLTEALAMVNKTGERSREAELYRLKGELLLAQEVKNQKLVLSVVGSKVKSQKLENPSPQPLTPSTQAGAEQEAEECFLKAIDVARRQQARSLELRVVMSLVRLRQQQTVQEESCNTQHVPRTTQHESRPKLDEAHKLLSEVYNWFIEGFDTKDLQEAKTLLDELSH